MTRDSETMIALARENEELKRRLEASNKLGLMAIFMAETIGEDSIVAAQKEYDRELCNKAWREGHVASSIAENPYKEAPSKTCKECQGEVDSDGVSTGECTYGPDRCEECFRCSCDGSC